MASICIGVVTVLCNEQLFFVKRFTRKRLQRLLADGRAMLANPELREIAFDGSLTSRCDFGTGLRKMTLLRFAPVVPFLY
jgi:hypothetical protein